MPSSLCQWGEVMWGQGRSVLLDSYLPLWPMASGPGGVVSPPPSPSPVSLNSSLPLLTWRCWRKETLFLPMGPGKGPQDPATHGAAVASPPERLGLLAKCPTVLGESPCTEWCVWRGLSGSPLQTRKEQEGCVIRSSENQHIGSPPASLSKVCKMSTCN